MFIEVIELPSYKGTLNVTAHELYTALLEQSIAEIKQITGKELTIEELEKGYKYTAKKQVGKEIKDATVHFKKTEPDRRIHVAYSLERYFYEMNYILTPLSENTVEFSYSQTMNNEKMNFIQKMMFENKMKRWMKALETVILNKRRTGNVG